MSPKTREEPAPHMIYVLYLNGMQIGTGYFDAETGLWYNYHNDEIIAEPEEWFTLEKQPNKKNP